jgi:TIR domain
MHDVFICHATEDKDAAARPVAKGLSSAGMSVWYDEFSLTLGDSLRRSIDRGLADSRYGAVILSPNFFKKNWPQAELDGLFAKEISGDKTILPIWHELDRKDVLEKSPLLADRVAAKTSDGIDTVIEKILNVLAPERLHSTRSGLTASVSPASIRLYSREWSVRTPVLIMNRSDRPIYQVTLKLEITTPGVPSESVEISPDAPTTSLQGSTADIKLPADLLMFDCLDSRGRELIGLVFHTLGPKQSREIVVEGTHPLQSNANVTVCSFKTNPAEVMESSGRVAIPFSFGEEMKVKGVRVSLTRT